MCSLRVDGLDWFSRTTVPIPMGTGQRSEHPQPTVRQPAELAVEASHRWVCFELSPSLIGAELNTLLLRLWRSRPFCMHRPVWLSSAAPVPAVAQTESNRIGADTQQGHEDETDGWMDGLDMR